MKIERVRIDAFGRLQDFDTGADALGDLVVVLGPNEAGKSTLFTFLTTALYGFRPASRDKNPHVPWGADEAAGRIQLVLSDEGCVGVERRLRSSPVGRMTRGEATHDLRNQPVPWVEHVPRTVFEQVFAIGLADLAGLDSDTWAHLQDRIVGSMGSSDLASARDVAEGLETEASSLWRPNRRGNQRIRDLREEMAAKRALRNEALERDRRIRQSVEERARVSERLTVLKTEREEHRVAVERVRSLLPVHRQRRHIATLRRRGGERADLEGLPDDPVATLSEAEDDVRRLRERASALDAERDEPSREVERFDDGRRLLLDRAATVEAFLARVSESAPDRRRVPELTDEVKRAEAKLLGAAERLLPGGWTDDAEAALAAVSVDLLRDRVGRWTALPDASERVEPDARPATPPPRWMLAATVAAGLVGLVLVAWSFLGASSNVRVVGAVALTAALFGVALLRRTDPAGVDATGPAGPDPEARRVALEREIRALLGGLDVHDEYLSPPGEPLVEGIARLRDLAADVATHRAALDAAGERVRAVDEEGLEVARTLGRVHDGSADALGRSLERELREAERVREAARTAERELGRLERERRAVRTELAAAEERVSTLRSALGPLGGGDPERGARRAAERLQAHRDADLSERELERTHPDLPTLMAQIDAFEANGVPWEVDDAELARHRAAIDALDEEIEELARRAEGIGHDVARLEEQPTADVVDSEIEALRDEERRWVRERDRKWVLARLVRSADRRFREEHQPDLVRRAGAHLARLTGGRYERMLVDETDPNGLFHVVGPGLPAPVPLTAPISTGTLEQAYLGLRLAIVDHLDREHERLPLFIDEAFVNWDDTRRARGLDVLAELCAERQIFVFTCHPSLAEQLGARGGRIIRLSRDH